MIEVIQQEEKEGRFFKKLTLDKVITRILWLFFGTIALHRFYKKYWISGIIMALTLGGFIIGWMIDGVSLVLNDTLLFQK